MSKKKKRVRKPAQIFIKTDDGKGNDSAFMVTEGISLGPFVWQFCGRKAIIDAKEVRRLANWLNNTADYIEQQESEE